MTCVSLFHGVVCEGLGKHGVEGAAASSVLLFHVYWDYQPVSPVRQCSVLIMGKTYRWERFLAQQWTVISLADKLKMLQNRDTALKMMLDSSLDPEWRLEKCVTHN
ncbi:jg5697 [Pararge aegeria aegeria]|uniref:Jg5697 protein n=1 Tax=Pararge aegeria aegeria TaxID=348720 RepID=A0A8S4SFE5_9NEOP|nr:jg5697 [Pararge aegeria aegeria]